MPKLSNSNLTLTRIQRAKVARDKDGFATVSYLWDADVPGFGIRINTTGKKTFVMKYRNPEGKQAWLVLGDYTGGSSIDPARAVARKYRDAIKKKLDPRLGIKQAEEIPTFAKFGESFIESQETRGVSEPYLKGIKYFVEKVAGPTIGGFRIDMIEQKHIEPMIEDYAKGKRPWMKSEEEWAKPSPINANRFRSVLHKLFRVAEKKGHRPKGTNPVSDVEKQPESKGRKRYLTMHEITWLGKVMKDAPKWNNKEACPYAWTKKDVHLIIPTVYAVAAVKLLLLTGGRLNEILRLKWSLVDKENKTLTIEQHKTVKRVGNKILPLTPAVLTVIEELEKLPTRRLGGEWVIQGHKLDSHLVNLTLPWKRVQEAVKRASEGVVNIDDVSLHILRHSFASVGVSSGESLAMVGGILGHMNPATTQRYSHIHQDPQMQVSQRISGTIADALGS